MSTSATPSPTSPTAGEAGVAAPRRGAVGYHVRTVLLGLIGVPLMVSVVWFALMPGGVWSWGPTSALLALPLAGAVVFALWWRWAGARGRPSAWRAALLPVFAVPAYYLLAWIVCLALAGNVPMGGLQRFGVAGLPWFVANLLASLTAQATWVPVTLALVFVASVAGFAVGYRRRRRSAGEPEESGRTGRIALVGFLVVGLALLGTAAGQLIAYQRYVDTPTVSDEVDLSVYQPFAPGNRLVTPVTPPGLRIRADYPRIDGATALYPVYAAAAQALYDVNGLDQAAQTDVAKRYVPCNTTTGAYNRLIAGDADVIVVARPSAGQLEAAKAAGVELSLTPLGREAFVFFVNADNPVDGLTQQQIRDIYTKTITNWHDVGGRNQAITPYQRPEGSGSQTAMLAQVMRGVPLAEAPREEIAEGMGGVLSRVSTYRNVSAALGYSFRWYATVMNPNAGIKLLTVDGVAPTPENIRNGTYPFIGDFYAVTRANPTPNTTALIDWLTSPEGQALIERVGYVGL